MSNFFIKRQGGNVAEIPSCLCEQIKHRKAEKPKMMFSSRLGEFLIYCPSCLIRTYPDSNKQSVIAEWFGMNKTGEKHIQDLWVVKYERQQKESASVNEQLGPRSQKGEENELEL